MASLGKRVSAEEAAARMRNKFHLYGALVAAGWCLPADSQAIVTIIFLNDVRYKRIAMLRFDELRILPCLHPPPTKVLV